MCFLEREVYAFLSGFAAQCCGPAFFCLWGGRRGRRWTGRRWVAGGTCELLRAERHRRNDTQRRAKQGKRAVFFFLRKDRRAFAYPPGGSRGRGAAVAALGYRHRRENVAGATAAWCGKTQLVEGCGLWPPFQLIQLIYLRYLYGSAEREKWMDVCFLLTLYI